MDYRFTQGGRPDRTGAIAGLFSNYRCGLFVLAIGVPFTLFLCSEAALARNGQFEIRTASSRLYNGIYLASARVDYDLSDEALEALGSGIALPINLRVELNRVRRWWPDKEVATLDQN